MSGRAAVVRVAALLVAAGLVGAAACAAPPPAGSRGAATGDEPPGTPSSPSSPPPPSAPARPAAPPSPAASEPDAAGRPSPDSPESRLLAAVNRARARRDLPPLSFDRRLAAAAEGHSRAMAERDFFAHCNPDSGSSASGRAEAAGYEWRAIAENLSVGQPTAEQVVEGWLGSRGHRENLLSPRYEEAGVGYVYQPDDRGNVRVDEDGDCDGDRRNGPYGHYWTMVYGTSR